VVINKCDETDAATINAVRSAIAGIAVGTAGAEIRETSWGELTRDDLPRPDGPVGSTATGPPAKAYRGWGGAKPLCRTWRPESRPTPAALEAVVHEWLAAGALRVKGSVETTDGVRRVNAVPDGVVVTTSPGGESASGAPQGENALVIFEPAPAPAPGENAGTGRPSGDDGPPFSLATLAGGGETCD
jgi:hypothetical protein